LKGVSTSTGKSIRGRDRRRYRAARDRRRSCRRCLFLLAFAALAHAEIIDRIAVSVGSHVITQSELDREIRVTAFLNGVKPDLSPAGKRATADRMVEQQLIRDELESNRYPIPAAGEVEPELNAFKKKYYPTEEAYQKALTADGIRDKDVRDELLWQRELLLFIEIRFQPGVQVSEQEIQDYFDKVVEPAARLAHPGQPISLEDYREQIENTLTGQRADEQMDNWLEQARRRTEIIYHPEVFQ